MDYFNELGKKISDASQIVAQRASDLADTASIQMNLSAKEKELTACYRALGEQCYKSCAASCDAALQPAIDAVTQKLAEIEDMQKQLQRLRGQKVCASCGTINEKDDVFCSQCGAKLPDPEPEPEPAVDADGEPACGCASCASDAPAPEDDAPKGE